MTACAAACFRLAKVGGIAIYHKDHVASLVG